MPNQRFVSCVHGRRSRALQQTVDLLYEEPQNRVSLKLLERALVFAFSAGDTDGAFDTVLSRAKAGESTYSAQCFAQDLFLDDFVAGCLQIKIDGQSFEPNTNYLRSVLCHPPLAPSTTVHRQRVFQELQGVTGYRSQLEQIYSVARSLRTLLSRADFTARMDQVQRRVDILQRLRSVFQLMADGFHESTSGLLGIREFGQSTVKSEAYARLCDVLEYEQHAASVDLNLRLGVDGSIRAIELTGHHDNQESAFYSTRFGRWWTRFKMLLRCYRFSEREILMRLLDQVFDGVKPQLLQLFQLIGDMEFYLCGLNLSDAAKQKGLHTCFPAFTPAFSSPSSSPEQTTDIQLVGLFNPFLLVEGVDVKACDLVAQADAVVVVTGPNSGGKTRLLQSLALAHLLGHCGMPIPAASARLNWTRGMFVSLVDNTSADQREGRLGMELLRIRNLFEQINVGDLVVLDELCSGTNPSEGEEIFQLVIELLAELKPQVWLTTHFLSFASSLQQRQSLPQLQFLQVELDEHEHPTFRFVPGVASTSLAGQTAKRLGVTRLELEQLVEQARERSSREAGPDSSAAEAQTAQALERRDSKPSPSKPQAVSPQALNPQASNQQGTPLATPSEVPNATATDPQS